MLGARGLANPRVRRGRYRFLCTGDPPRSARSAPASCSCRSARSSRSRLRRRRPRRRPPMIERRTDGRAPDELRPTTIEPGFVRTATGSALIACGETRVICTASVQESVPRWMAGQGRGWVTAEYGMLPASTGDRKQRDVTQGPARRPHRRDPAADRPLAARRRRLRGARRAHDLHRLRRAAGRRRHPLRVDHRRLRGARARGPHARGRRPARELAAHRHRRRGLVRDRRRGCAARPRLPRGLDRRGRRQRRHDRRRRPGRGPGDGRAHAAVARAP